MNMLRMKRLCRGGIFIAFVCLMSISLTGCAWLAALAPILSSIGSAAGMVGSIVSIFSPGWVIILSIIKSHECTAVLNAIAL